MTTDSLLPSLSYLTAPSSLLKDSNAGYHRASVPSSLDEEASLGIRRVGIYPVVFGGSSDVWKAEMRGRNGTTVLVALKVLRPTVSTDRMRKREEREMGGTSLRHDNIAPLYCKYHQRNGSPVFVSPWYKNGTADIYLGLHSSVNPMKIICEIASGVEYLHDNGIVHGDIKGSNIMIDDGGHARLIDFGLCRFTDCERDLTTSTSSTLRWCAPELLFSNDTRPTMSSDVYALASTVLELLTGDVPYATLPKWTVYQNISQGVGPRHSSAPFRYNVLNPKTLWDALEPCWDRAPARPSISEVKRRLKDVRI